MSVAVAPVLPMLFAQTRAQLLNYVRIPAFSLTSLALPLVFYTFFGLPNAGKHFPDGTSVGLYLMCSFGAYAVSSVMVIFALVALVVLIFYVVVVGGVHFPVEIGLEIVGLLLIGALPLIGMGMAIGYTSGPNAAPAVANLIYLPMAFASGMFVPVGDLPDFIQKVAKYLPTYHYAQLAYTPVHHADEPLRWALLWSAVWAVILFAAAIRAYRRDALRKFS